MIDQTTPPTLDLWAGPLDGPTVIRLDGQDAVVLTSSGNSDEIAVWTGGSVRCYPAATVAQVIANPVRQEVILRAAVRSLYQLALAAEDEWAYQADDHAETLYRMREYAIRAHREGDIAAHRLDAFLGEFELDAYEPCVQLDYSLTGRFTTTESDSPALRAAIADLVKPNFEAVEAVNAETILHRTTVTATQPQEAANGQALLVVTFAISGSYDVGYDDVWAAENDGSTNLRLSCEGVAGLLPASMTYEIESLYGERLD